MKWNLYDDDLGQWGKVIVEPKLNQHTEKDTSASELGHVKIDEDSIVKNPSGQIVVSENLKNSILTNAKLYTDNAIDANGNGITISDIEPIDPEFGDIWFELEEYEII